MRRIGKYFIAFSTIYYDNFSLNRIGVLYILKHFKNVLFILN